MNKNNYLIIYHKEDNDGLFSMAIIYSYLTNELKIPSDNIHYEGHDYGSVNTINIEDIINEYSNVIMTDISMQPDRMIKLYSFITGEFTWIDHHAPIIKQSFIDGFDSIPGLRDTTRSAILNAYKYLYDQFDIQYNDKTLPELFRILSAWDSFSYEREGYDIDFVRNVNVGANLSYKLLPKLIMPIVDTIIYDNTNTILLNLVNALYDIGKTINLSKDIEYADIIKNVGDMRWTVDGRSACALFIQGASNSLMFKTVKDTVKHGIVFKRNANGDWVMSLYNTSTEYDKEFHCGEYLKKKYSGGGHAGAAGCKISQEKFIELLKTLKI